MELFQRARIPKNHWEATLAAIPKDASHLDTLIEYTEDIVNNVSSGKGMYFCNMPGRGKSAAAAIVAKCAIAHRLSVLWVEAAKIIKYKIEEKTELFDDDTSLYARAESVSLLVIDEFYIGAHAREDYYTERLIRTRIDGKKATIITSNMSQPALKQKLPMLHSVLSECTEFVVFDPTVNFRPKQ